jgi:6-phosphogluconolactonase/glucosamine-6-phosphate isomerase/deaminase
MGLMITFRKVSSTDPVVEYITGALTQRLAKNKRVLWLVPGGSSIAVAVAVSQKLTDVPLDKLAVTLTDERYGEVGHADSNWRQLSEAGFKLSGARLRPVLTGASFDATVISFAEILEEELDRADYRLGFFGMGPDGHTAGILPGSPAVEADDLTEGYEAGPLTRITMTPAAIECLDEAVVYAVGEAKWPVLDQLDGEIDFATQPAQALKSVPQLTIFNDHKGE